MNIKTYCYTGIQPNQQQQQYTTVTTITNNNNNNNIFIILQPVALCQWAKIGLIMYDM